LPERAEFMFLRISNGYAGANARRRISAEKQGPRDKQGPTVVHQKPGPLQTIFDLPADEVSLFTRGRMLLSLNFRLFPKNFTFWNGDIL